MPLTGLCAAVWALLLQDLVLGEMASGAQCSSGQSWSSDLGKCRDCTICQNQPKNDFCTTCDTVIPQGNEWMWYIVGGVLGVVMLAFAISAFLLLRRCKKKEKFTTPIEETGGHSPEDALIH